METGEAGKHLISILRILFLFSSFQMNRRKTLESDLMVNIKMHMITLRIITYYRLLLFHNI